MINKLKGKTEMNISYIELSRSAFNAVHINTLCKIAQETKFKNRALVLMKSYWRLEEKQPKTEKEIQSLQKGYSKLNGRLKKLIDDSIDDYQK